MPIYIHFPAFLNQLKVVILTPTTLLNLAWVFFFLNRVVYSVLFDSWEIIGPYRAWWLLNGLLLVLQALHIIWFYLIARIAIKAIFKGKVSLLVVSNPVPCYAQHILMICNHFVPQCGLEWTTNLNTFLIECSEIHSPSIMTLTDTVLSAAENIDMKFLWLCCTHTWTFNTDRCKGLSRRQLYSLLFLKMFHLSPRMFL